jgi:hypothetical protein
MSNPGCQFLKMVFLSVCVSSELSALENTIEMESVKPETFSFALTSGLSETPVDADSADHVRILFFKLSGSYSIPLPTSSLIQTPSISVSVGYSDQIDVEDNETNLENSEVSFSGIGYTFSDEWKFTLPVTSTVATNDDDAVYLGYIGSLSVTPGFTLSPSHTWLQGASLFLGSTFSRSFYRFDVSKGGRYNAVKSFAPRLRVGYEIAKWHLSASLANTTVYLSDGSRLDDTYSSSLGVDYQISSKFSGGVSWSQRDRTFGYDGTSANINFGYADLTLLSLMLTYSI